MNPVLGYHAIFSAYGFWLPNDPRGSWSEFVGSYDLYRYGPATKTEERRSLAYDPHDRARRLHSFVMPGDRIQMRRPANLRHPFLKKSAQSVCRETH